MPTTLKVAHIAPSIIIHPSRVGRSTQSFDIKNFYMESLCLETRWPQVMGTNYRGTDGERRALDAYIKLRRAANTLSALESASLREFGLTERQFGVLEALFHLGPLRQTDLASKLLCSAGNLTMVVDNLERDGLVERRRDSEDRRVVTVHLTADGRKLIEHLFPRHVAAIVNWFAVLESDEQVRLSEALRRLGRQDTITPATAGSRETES